MTKNEKKKILMVDDDEVHLEIAEALLEGEYEIFKATSGFETLEFLNKNLFIPDLILLDIIMIEMNGWEVFKKIREIAEYKDVPIAFLTSVNEEGEKRKALALGAAEYITKPYDAEYLQNTIREILKNSKN